jgi:DNA-directed RNA polymerase specialized sigma24 family protein
MDELQEFCVRVLGAGDAASIAEQVRDQGAADPIERLAAAAAICHARAEPDRPASEDGSEASEEELPFAQAVARELAAATAAMPQRQREALALRELLALSYRDISRVMRIEATAVPPLLARARLRLRRELRGGPDATPDCAERDRSLRALTLRQDRELSDEAENAWLLEHLGACDACTGAHAAMLEASVCYRAWRPQGGTESAESNGDADADADGADLAESPSE